MQAYFYRDTTLDDFIQYVKTHRTLELYCDLETFQSNTKAEQISEVDVWQYATIVFWEKRKGMILPNLTELITLVLKHSKSQVKYQKNGKVDTNQSFQMELHFYNGMKYDNHFLIRDTLMKDFSCVEQPLAIYNDVEIPDQCYQSYIRPNHVLTSRIRSGSSIEGVAYVLHEGKSCLIKMIDDYPKFAMSLAKCGEVLCKRGLIGEEDCKTDFDYHVFDCEEKLDYGRAKVHAYRCFDRFTEDQLVYMFNDGVLLAHVVAYYNDIMGHGFKYKARTATINVANAFIGEGETYDPIVDFQLTRRVKALKWRGQSFHVCLSDYSFAGLNLMDYFYRFYKGGMCIYNENHLGKKIKKPWGSMDLNSSYPTVYCTRPLPLGKPLSWKEYPQPVTETIDYECEEYTTFYQITCESFNELMQSIPSVYQKCGMIRYLNSKDGYYYLTSIHLLGIRDHCHSKKQTIDVLSKIVVKNEPFKGREQALKFYELKTCGKIGKKIDMSDPQNIQVLNEVIEECIPPALVGMAKRCINSLYGLPAIKAFFKRCVVNEDGKLEVIHQGHKNSERNCLFSIGVTAWALYNLWEPLMHLTPKEIDRDVMYQDTDSLYVLQPSLDKIVQSMGNKINKINLGGWDIEHIGHEFYISNHKKYCFTDDQTGLDFRFGGCRKSSFDTSLTFDEFVDTYMAVGCTVKNTRSVMNVDLKPVIYEGKTLIKDPFPYRHDVSELDFMDQLLEQDTVRNLLEGDVEEDLTEDTPNTDSYSGFVMGEFGAYSLEEPYQQDRMVPESDLISWLTDMEHAIDYLEAS